MVEHAGEDRRESLVDQRRPPENQETVKVELLTAALVSDVRLEKIGYQLNVGLAPRKVACHGVPQRTADVDAAGVNVDKGRRPRHALVAPAQALGVTEQIH